MTILPLVQLERSNFMSKDTPLRRPSNEVIDFGSDFQKVVDDLIETFLSHNIAVGLAAPQVGIALRLAVINVSKGKKDETLVVVNPRILSRDEKKELKRESCMSLPGYGGDVERSYKMEVSFQDRYGERQVMEPKGYLARVFQHEIDHLDGFLYLDRMDDPERQIVEVDIFNSD
jgi:peptide deformylase